MDLWPKKIGRVRVRFNNKLQNAEVGEFAEQMMMVIENKDWFCETYQEKHNMVVRMAKNWMKKQKRFNKWSFSTRIQPVSLWGEWNKGVCTTE